MTTGSLSRNLFDVAWPVMVSSLVQTLYNLADAFWLGKLGRTALVAPTITMNIVFTAMALAMGFSAGATTLVSQFRGARRFDEMRTAAGQALVLLAGTGVVLGGIGLVFSRQILSLMQTPADAFHETLVYLRWALVGMPAMFSFMAYQGAYTGIGDTIGPLQVNLITALFNAFLDPFLIFGIGPLPKLGVAGAAIATFVTRSVAGGMGIARLLTGNRGFGLDLRHLSYSSSMIRRMLKIGLPVAVAQSGTSLGFTVMMSIVNTFGSAVTAAFGIGHRIIHMAMVPTFGLAQANATAVGQNLGAGNTARAGRSVAVATSLTAVLLLPIVTLMFFFGDAIARIFISDPEVVRYGYDLFHITSFSVFVFGFIMVLMGSFQGSGHTMPIMVLNMSRLWLLRIPGAYILGKVLGMGPMGIWWAVFLSNVVTALAAAVWFSRGTWKRSSVIAEPRGGRPAPTLG